MASKYFSRGSKMTERSWLEFSMSYNKRQGLSLWFRLFGGGLGISRMFGCRCGHDDHNSDWQDYPQLGECRIKDCSCKAFVQNRRYQLSYLKRGNYQKSFRLFPRLQKK